MTVSLVLSFLQSKYSFTLARGRSVAFASQYAADSVKLLQLLYLLCALVIVVIAAVTTLTAKQLQ